MDRNEIVKLIMAVPSDTADERTGLPRETYFRVILAREVTRILRTGEPLTIGILGIDQDGPAEGAIDRVGAIIRKQIREVDVATYCGGLFPLFLSRTSAGLAHIAGERIRKAVTESSAGATTVSIGLASFPEDGLDRETVAGKAADAFLRAVEAGGNRVYYVDRPQRKSSQDLPRVLIVDDDARNLKLLGAQLVPLGYEVLTASSGVEALGVVQGVDVDLVILDVMMPGLSGFDTCRRMKGSESTRQVPVILLTALNDAEARLKGIESGADDFISKPANREELLARTRSLIGVKRMNRDLVSLENALISLANAVEAKDNYTLGHTQRVSTLAVAVGSSMGLDDVDLKALRLGGILHDVGKIGVPEAILNKPGPLSDEEWVLMKSHAELGYKICLPLMESIGPALDVIRHHHEKLDGSSYPDGLRGSGVSVMARIMAVVDCYDAMVTDRPYRSGMDKEKALTLLREDVTRGKLDGRVLDTLAGLVGGRRGS